MSIESMKLYQECKTKLENQYRGELAKANTIMAEASKHLTDELDKAWKEYLETKKEEGEK